MDLSFYNSYIEVDLNTIRANLKKVIQHIGPNRKLIPVIKGNAYGLGTVPIARVVLEEFKVPMVGVAQICEGAQIRDAGIKGGDILVMGACPDSAIPYAVDYGFQLPLFNKSAAKALSDAAKAKGIDKVKAHIKVETGLNRIGVKPGRDMDELLDYIEELGNIVIDGCFTHYSTATTFDSDFTKEQYDIFCKGYAQVTARGHKPTYVHTCNSGATVWLEDDCCNHVRLAALYLGYSAMTNGENRLGIKEPASWRCFITNIHEVVPGESVGYSRYFKPEKPTMVATIDIGYADGFFRPLAMGYGPVMVNGVRTRYLGMCMDQTFVDVTGIDCKLGDEATIFGYDKVSGELLSPVELGPVVGQNYASLISAPNDRVKRTYLHE